MARRLLSGLHGEQPDRREDLGDFVPALDGGALLEEGGVPRGGARSRTAARRLERAGRIRREADETRRLGQRDPMGNADSLERLSVLAVPGTRDRERRGADEPAGRPNFFFQARRRRSAAILG